MGEKKPNAVNYIRLFVIYITWVNYINTIKYVFNGLNYKSNTFLVEIINKY